MLARSMTREFPTPDRELRFAPCVTAICLVIIGVSCAHDGVFVPAFTWGPPIGLLQLGGALRSWKTKSWFATSMTAALTVGVCAGAAEDGGYAWGFPQMFGVVWTFASAPLMIWRSQIREWLRAEPS